MRYQFQSEQGNTSFKPKIFTEAIKVLIWINVGLFALKFISQSQIDLARIFGLSSNTVWPMIWQPVTYMFIHGDVFHVLINMFVLWMFGSEMESIWGRKQFLRYYFLTGIGSGLIWLLFNSGQSYAVLIGASGAIYGVLVAYGFTYPNRIINIHPSLLPAFPGAMAYAQAFERGTKIIGVTSHYVTENLDQGPIIFQDSFNVKPEHTLESIKRAGQKLEAEVLLKAVKMHLADKLEVRWRKVHTK